MNSSAWTSEPPASGSSRSRQANTWTRPIPRARRSSTYQARSRTRSVWSAGTGREATAVVRSVGMPPPIGASRYPRAVPFVLGGSLRWRGARQHLPGFAAIAVVLAVIALPLRGLYRSTGASMEEGFMLVFPNLVRQGKVPNVDFLHLYGPASLDALALWYRVFGDTLESQRTFGLAQHRGVVFGIYALCRVAGHVAAAGAAIVATFLIITPIGLSALAWHGALALGLWATVFGVRARCTGSVGSLYLAGGLAGLALGFRPD